MKSVRGLSVMWGVDSDGGDWLFFVKAPEFSRTGANVSSKSTPGICEKPCATNIALYRSICSGFLKCSSLQMSKKISVTLTQKALP